MTSVPVLPSVTALVLTLATLAAAAGPPDNLPIYVPLQEEVETRLVLVPVSALDRNRQPVLDLTVADFSLKVDGKPYPMSTFDPPLLEPPASATQDAQPGQNEVPHPVPLPDKVSSGLQEGEAAARPGPPASSRPRVHVALVIDLFQTRPAWITAGFSAAREALERGVPAGARIGLFVIGTGGRLRTLTPFTSDGGALLQALDAAAGNTELRDLWLQDEESRRQIVRSSTPPADEAAVRSYSIEQAMRYRRLLNSLEILAAAMANYPGRRSVVMVGDGLREQAGINYALGNMNLADESHSLRAEFRETTRLFKAAGVSLSPVSLLGVYASSRFDAEGLDEMIGSLQFLAKQTGGRRPIATNNFTAEIGSAVEQPLAAYLLGFRPPPRQGAGTVHSISVRVNRPGVQITFRSEYIEAGERLTDAVRTAGAAILPEGFTDLPVEVSAVALPAAGKNTEISVQVVLQATSVAWLESGPGRRAGRLRIQGLLRDSTGRAEPLFDAVYPLAAAAVDPPERIIVQEARELPVPRDAEIVIIVIDEVTGRIGSRVLPVPAQKTEDLRVSVPVMLQEFTGTYFLSADGEPLLGLRQGNRLFLPAAGIPTEATPMLAIARLTGLPPGARVRFCLSKAEADCAEARLEEVVPRRLSPEKDKPPPRWSAWIALDAESSRRARHIKVEVVDEAGAVIAPQAP